MAEPPDSSDAGDARIRDVAASAPSRPPVAGTAALELPAAEGARAEVGAPRATVARSAALVTAGIVVSRLFGLVRQRVTAHYFGTSAFADAVGAAFRIGNVTQNLLGEGTLSASFIPVYAKLRARGDDRGAVRFALSSLGLVAAAAAIASAIGAALAPWLAPLLVGGFAAEPLRSTVGALRIVFPMTGLLVVSAWALGVLNVHRRFLLPYAAPVVWSAAQIAGLVAFGAWLRYRGEPLVLVLAWAALTGAALQLALLLFAARRHLGALRPRLDVRDAGVREAGAKLPAAILGRGVIQISGLVDTHLASLLGAGALASLNYAQTIYLLPMGLLGTGEAAAQLPEMARAAADADTAKRRAEVRDRLGESLGRLCVLAVPCAVALALFGGEIVRVLFETGAFDRDATSRVRPLLGAYAAALLGNASGRLFAATSFAFGDTARPAWYAAARVAASAAIALALMRPLGVLGIVIGAACAGWIEAVALGARVRALIGGLGLRRVRVGRVAALTATCAAAGLATRALLGAALSETRAGALAVLAAFGVAFVAAAPMLGLVGLRGLLRRR